MTGAPAGWQPTAPSRRGVACGCRHSIFDHASGEGTTGRCSRCTCESFALESDVMRSQDFREAINSLPPPLDETRTGVLAVRQPVRMGEQDGGWFVRMDDNKPGSGLYVEDSLLVILSAAPTFSDAGEAERWLSRAGEQSYFPGDLVRVSELRGRDKAIQHGRIVKYLGVTGKEPPKYLIEVHGEPRIVASYFLRGLVEPVQTLSRMD